MPPRRYPALRAGHLDEPHPSRLAVAAPRRAEILARHAEAIAAGAASYRDPATGYSVFTARFLADRGYCCDSGCRHCPYVGATDTSGAADPAGPTVAAGDRPEPDSLTDDVNAV